MKKFPLIILCFNLLLTISIKANAQLLNKLKEKAGVISSSNPSNSNEGGTVEEEKIKNIGKSYTITTSYGDVKYDIDKSAEMIAENKSADGTTQHFLTTTKKQYIFHSITTNNNNAATKMEKTIVNKNQIAYCASTSKYAEGQYQVTIYLLSRPVMKRIKAGENTESTLFELKLVLYTNIIEKANSLITSILGKDVNGSQLNSFVYVTGDEKVVKASANPFWSLQDGILYFESLSNEKALRVTYFIYDKQASATTETITDRFRLVSNEFGSVATNQYCNIVVQQLPADVKGKFKKEIQEPIAAKRVAEEKERERLYAESQRNSGSSGSSSSNSGSKQKTEFYVALQNKSDVKVKVEVRSAKGSSKQQFELSQRNTKRVEVQVGATVFVNGGQVATISAGMEGKEIIIAQ